MKQLILILCLFFAAASASLAQSTVNDWNSLEALNIGANVFVATKSGRELKGKLLKTSATGIEVKNGSAPVTISRDDIQSVHRSRRGSMLKRTLIGAAAGAGIGFGVGGIVAVATKTNGLAAAGGFLYGIPIGAAIGAATTGRKRSELIYRAP